ncbi:hypothetical protein EMPS_04794 [Entomortierella parvispora]|uniref:Gfd2/YDR514C-like C-terminal domain-containing protein n=1 Tax=Entomortierella parvispora TaxID=205924 RepID=A0A9P3H9W8_9FUNG|nr:hypothetical protein EMPS_04794 [Entomortierella parvispora]
MLSTSFLLLDTATYEWRKDSPGDISKEIKEFFTTATFFDRPNVFYRGLDDTTKKWVALMSMAGVEETREMLCQKWNHSFPHLYASKGPFSQVQAAPKMPVLKAYSQFLKDIEKLNKIRKAKAKLHQFNKDFNHAAELYRHSPAIRAKDGSTSTSGDASASTTESSSSSSGSGSPSVPAMWFVSVDIESYEMDHSKILEIGWSIWDSGLNVFQDKHYAVQEYRHLKNGRWVADRRDRFMFGETLWAPLKECAMTFQDDLEKAARYNDQGQYALIAHDMGSDEKYLRQMGVKFPKGMIQFDTKDMNAARANSAHDSTKLETVLDQMDIENYCLHNAGNDAHYTLELFLALIRDRIANQEVSNEDSSIPVEKLNDLMI